MAEPGAEEAFFAALEALAPLAEADKRSLRSLLRPRVLPAGDFFVRAGSPTEQVGFLLSGVLRYFFVGQDGREFTRYFCQGKNFVSSYTALETRRPSAYSIQALRPAELLIFSYSDWKALVERSPALAQIEASVHSAALILAEERERSLVLDDASTRYQRFLADFPGLEAQVHQYDIASYLGISPVTLSRIRGRPAKTPEELT